MFTQAMGKTVVAVIVVSFVCSMVLFGVARADSLVVGGQQDRGNVMPAAKVDLGLVAGNSVESGLVAGTRQGKSIEVSASDVAKAAQAATEETAQPVTAQEKAVIEKALGTTIDETQKATERPTHILVRMYDANHQFIGFQSVKLTYDENGRITGRTTTTYDNQGRRIGTRSQEYTYKLDDDGKVTTMTVTSKKDGKVINTSEHIFTYNDKGQVVERTAVFKDAKGNVIRNVAQTNTYNDKGQLTAGTIVRKDGKGHRIETVDIKNTYDENGKLTKQTAITKDRAGNKSSVSVTDYKDGIAQKGVTKFFDNSGKLTRKFLYSYS